ncbi:MAG: YbbR-like domain-containing protein [Acidobacteria bacterium]|nr:YbbR-like domain-containing protein [Acidobacteriota bacterium]
MTGILRKIFLEDWTMKLIALVITLALWFGVSGLREPKTERLRNVALNLRVSNDVEITNSPVKEIDIVVTGDDRKISQINKENLIVSLDLTDSLAGDRSVQITPENINVDLPTGVKVVDIQPDRIAVKLEKVEEREITVKVETEGALPDNLEVYQTTAVPGKVRVRAPESYIKTLDLISTEKIDLSGKTNDFTERQVSLVVLSPKVKLIDTIVDVFVRVGEKRTERLYLLPLFGDETGRSAKIVLYGPRSVFESLANENIRVEAVKNESGETVLNVTLPADVQDRVEVREKKFVKKQ